MTIYNYAKLSAEEKELLLKNEAILLENYTEDENTIHVYFLNGFFIEITITDGKIVENLPYKRGFKFSKKNAHAIEKRNTIYNVAA